MNIRLRKHQHSNGNYKTECDLDICITKECIIFKSVTSVSELSRFQVMAGGSRSYLIHYLIPFTSILICLILMRRSLQRFQMWIWQSTVGNVNLVINQSWTYKACIREFFVFVGLADTVFETCKTFIQRSLARAALTSLRGCNFIYSRG